MSIGLVLGAGGATAWVFHAGVLRSLHVEMGVEPGEVELIVGTSAGASIAAPLRAGVGVEEIFEAITRPPSEDDRTAMLAELKASPKTLKPLAVGMVRDALPGGRGATFALAGLLPPGLFPTSWLASLPGMSGFDEWPAGLWIPALRVRDGDLVVFGKERRDVRVSDAVEASSAVPGMFRPKRIGQDLFVDGGVASSTHADLLVGAGMDRVIVSAPMSRPSWRPFARNARRSLEAEVAALKDRGVDTIVIERPPEVDELARGYPRRRPEAAGAIAAQAVEATRLALASV